MAEKLTPEQELEKLRLESRAEEIKFQAEQQTRQLYTQALSFAQQNKEEGVSLLTTATKYLAFLTTGKAE